MAIHNIFTTVFIIILAILCITIAIPSKVFNCPDDCYCYFSRINWVTNCSKSNLTSIPFEELDNDVYTLNMNENLLRTIKNFPKNIKVRTLLLSKNNLSTIEKSTFFELEYLVDIDLSFNSIVFIHPDTFLNNTGLISLNLQGNPLGPVAGAFLNARSLLHLNLVKCIFFNLIPWFFVNIGGLHTLDLSYSYIPNIEEGLFDPLTSLQTLKLNNCSINRISDIAFKNLESLTSLEMRGNDLRDNINWLRLVGKLKRLEHLDLLYSGVWAIHKIQFPRTIILTEFDFLDHVPVKEWSKSNDNFTIKYQTNN